MDQITVTTTEGLVELAKAAHESNGSFYEDELEQMLDPDGIHMLGFSMVHNDVGYRTQWFIKLKDQDIPHLIWLDVPFEAFNTYTTKMDAEVEDDND